MIIYILATTIFLGGYDGQHIESPLSETIALNFGTLAKKLSLSPPMKNFAGTFTSHFTYSHGLDVGDKNQSSDCQRDWDIIQSYQEWEVAKFWDSFAQEGSGLLEGRITYLGQSEECTNVKNGVMPVTFDNFPDVKPFLVYYKDKPRDFFQYTVAVCMPATCSTKEVTEIYKEYKNPKIWRAPFMVGASEQPTIRVTTGAVIAWVVFSAIAFLTVVGTVVGLYIESLGKYRHYQALQTNSSNQNVQAEEDIVRHVEPGKDNDGIDRDKTRIQLSIIVKLLLCFDFIANVKKILAIPIKGDPNQLKFLNGIRVMSMAWVILGHALSLHVSMIDNIVFAFDQSTNFLFLTLTNATPSVDTFFVLSGLLVMMGSLRSLEKLDNQYDPKFWAMFYVHRLIRLWPTLLLGILFLLGIVPLFSVFTSSPYFQPYAPQGFVDLCEGDKWLSTAFFYGNFDALKSLPCIGWTWYVANDMQFYVLSPVLIVLVHKRRLIGSSLIGLLIFCSCLITLIISAAKNALPGDLGSSLIGDPAALEHYNKDPYYGNMLYYASYCRFHTYGIGLLLGIVVHEKKKLEAMIDRLSLKARIGVIIGSWALAVLLGVVTIYGVYATVHGHPMDRTATAFYNGTFRLLWAIAVSLVILLCLLGYGGVANKILSSDFWIPFARINYTTYIVHLTLLYCRLLTVEKLMRYSTIEFVLECSGILALIFCVSVPLCAVMETPFINLERILLRRNRK